MEQLFQPTVGFMQSMRAQHTQLLTRQRFDEITQRETVRRICLEQIPAQQQKGGDIKALKEQLPVFIFMAHCEENGQQPLNTTARATRLCLHDFDHLPFDVRDFYRLNVEAFSEQLGLVLAHITPSGRGLRLVTLLHPGETIIDCQKRVAQTLSLERDKQVGNISRISFAVPREYILYVSDTLFSLPAIPCKEEAQVSKTEICSKATATNFNNESLFSSDSAATQLAKAVRPVLPSSAIKGTSAFARAMQYERVPLADIIENLIERIGKEANETEGTRNTALYKVARELRPITQCEFVYTYQLLQPYFLASDFDDAEIRQTISSAISKEGGYTLNPSPMLRSIIKSLQAQQTVDDGVVLPPYDLLPPLIQHILDCYPERDRLNALLLMLPMLGTWASGLRFQSADGRTNSLEFLVVVEGDAGSGKSFAKHLDSLLMTPLRLADNESRRIAEEERKEREAKKNMNERQVRNEHPVRTLTQVITFAQLINRLSEARGKHMYWFSEELKTLLDSASSAYGSGISNIWKAAFDNAEFGKETANDMTANVFFNVYVNIAVTCQMSVLMSLFSNANVGDGTASRFIIGELSDGLEERAPRYQRLGRKDQMRLDLMLSRLNAIGSESKSGTEYVASDALIQAMDDYIDEQIDIYKENGNREYRILANRAAVYGLRFGMLMWLLWGRPKGMCNGTPGVHRNQKMQRVIDSAKWFAHYVQNMQYKYISQQMFNERISGNGNLRASFKPVDILQYLPDVFEVKEYVSMKFRLTGHTDQNPSQTLCRIAQQKGLIQKHPDGKHWQKVG